MKQLTAISALCLAITAPLTAQNAALLSAQNAASQQGQNAISRTANYAPEGMGIVCVNGNNRYTRALYGSYTAYRIETSDRPVFAVYQKKACKNISFALKTGKTIVRLDSTDYCKATYQPYRRDYTLRDARWGDGEVTLSVISFIGSEGAIWRITLKGFEETATVEATLCETTTQKMTRNGDIGSFRNPTAFDAAAHPVELQTAAQSRKGDGELFFILNGTTLTADARGTQGRQRYDECIAASQARASSVVFHTPDAFLNPLGGMMVSAADGAWDGTVWNHGAVGWRMPLPGWRAAYMGDFLGMNDRQKTHFEAYANSQVTDVQATIAHPTPDTTHNLSRGEYRWGTPMYSNGYICRTPNNNHQFNHYDMNLSYIDELLWHFSFDADTTMMRRMWPVLTSHLAWEKRNWDPDGDHLYDAYCCIWASDALQYNSGAGTHSSAYNYRGNLLAARIAEIIGEDPAPYRKEAEDILAAMNRELWVSDEGHWAEFKDFMGLKRLHKSAALWSIYTPIDCGACSPEQAYAATRYVDRNIPHVPFAVDGHVYRTLSTSDWQPYEWSINNVAMAEVMHTVLAYYEAGRTEEAYRLLKASVLDFMYLASSPGNLGQISPLDVSLGESYRDFSDVTGITSRTFLQGLYGITPDALNGQCIIRPGFPQAWNKASVSTPYLDYSFERVNGQETFKITQRFARPLQIVLRRNTGNGQYVDVPLTADAQQTITLPALAKEQEPGFEEKELRAAQGTAFDDVQPSRCKSIDLTKTFNAAVTDIFQNEYLSPRSPYTTLSLPKQGIGDWCSTKRTAKIDDSGLRQMAEKGVFRAAGIPFRTPQQGQNIVYTSLWDNYPDSVVIALSGRASHVYLMMAGSTNPMQSQISNGILRVEYTDGTTEELLLTNPDNWCPIEQDYEDGTPAFTLPHPRPLRVGLSTGHVSRTLFEDLQQAKGKSGGDIPSLKRPAKIIPGGAAQLIDFPTNPQKKLRSLTLRTLANDVVMGIMAITVQFKN